MGPLALVRVRCARLGIGVEAGVTDTERGRSRLRAVRRRKRDMRPVRVWACGAVVV